MPAWPAAVVLGALKRIGPKLQMTFSPSSVFLRALTEDDKLAAFAELASSKLFTGDYHVESTAGDVVNLEASSELMVQCLKHGATGGSTVLKLSNRRGSPSLCCEVTREDGLTTTHDVPVLIVSRAAAAEMQKPVVPPLDVLLQMHSDDPLKPVVDRLKSLERHVELEMDPRGAMAVSARSEQMAAKSFFRDLRAIDLSGGGGARGGGGGDGDDEAEGRPCSARVNARLLSRALLACSGQRGTVLCLGISTGVILFIHLRIVRCHGGVTVLIPVIPEEPEGDEEGSAGGGRGQGEGTGILAGGLTATPPRDEDSEGGSARRRRSTATLPAPGDEDDEEEEREEEDDDDVAVRGPDTLPPPRTRDGGAPRAKRKRRRPGGEDDADGGRGDANSEPGSRTALRRRLRRLPSSDSSAE